VERDGRIQPVERPAPAPMLPRDIKTSQVTCVCGEVMSTAKQLAKHRLACSGNVPCTCPQCTQGAFHLCADRKHEGKGRRRKKKGKKGSGNAKDHRESATSSPTKKKKKKKKRQVDASTTSSPVKKGIGDCESKGENGEIKDNGKGSDEASTPLPESAASTPLKKKKKKKKRANGRQQGGGSDEKIPGSVYASANSSPVKKKNRKPTDLTHSTSKCVRQY